MTGKARTDVVIRLWLLDIVVLISFDSEMSRCAESRGKWAKSLPVKAIQIHFRSITSTAVCRIASKVAGKVANRSPGRPADRAASRVATSDPSSQQIHVSGCQVVLGRC